MGRILVLQSGPGLGGIVGRLVAGRHTVIEQTQSTGTVTPPRSGVRFDAIVCGLSDPRAVYETYAKNDPPQALKIIFVLDSAWDWATQNLPNPCLVRPFRLEELTAAIDSVLDGSAGGPPPS